MYSVLTHTVSADTMTDLTPEITSKSTTDDGEADTWSGLSDPAERRRRQNRINQRAYRKLLFVPKCDSS